MPLAPAARAALDLAAEVLGDKGGRLFDAEERSLRDSLKAAVRACGLQDRRISVYDFKQTRLTIDANSGAPLPGVAYLAGHKSIATTAKYIQSGEAAAGAVLAALNRAGKSGKIRRPENGAQPEVHSFAASTTFPAASATSHRPPGMHTSGETQVPASVQGFPQSPTAQFGTPFGQRAQIPPWHIRMSPQALWGSVGLQWPQVSLPGLDEMHTRPSSQ